jgi:hypothetical protein
MALAYALKCIDERDDVRLTNYGEYLRHHPPTCEVEIVEDTAWSCAHGVGRWREHCGCNSGGRPGWTQHWRGPLRAALDWLRDEVAPLSEVGAGGLFADPWAARDGYIDAILDRRPRSVNAFLRHHAGRRLKPAETVAALKWLELQRNCLLMYTSCGWFFDELSGIETVQVLQYAGRAVQLAEELTGRRIEPEFVARLSAARSNLPHLYDGRRVYEKYVRPARVDLAKVAAHYAVSSLFESYPERAALFCYTAEGEDRDVTAIGPARLAVGRVRVASDITREWGLFDFAAVHFGEVNLHGGVRIHEGSGPDARRRRELAEAFSRYDIAEVIRLLDRGFAAAAYSLRSLFRDEQQKVLAQVTAASTEAMEAAFRQVYAAHAPVTLVLQGLDRPALPAFQRVADFLVNLDLRRALEADEPDLERVRKLLHEVQLYGVTLDAAGLAFALRGTVARQLDRVAADPGDVAPVLRAEELLDLADALSFPVEFWKAQNTYYELLRTAYPGRLDGDETDRVWAVAFAALGARLKVFVADDTIVQDSVSPAASPGPPTACNCTAGSRSTTPPPSCRTWPSWASVTPTPRPSFRPAPAARTATTSWTTARSTPNSAARRGSSGSPRRCTNTASACCWTPCPTTWASTTRPTGGGWTCWRTAPARRRPPTSTSTGSRSSRNWPARCCCRSWRTSTAPCWRRASSASPTRTGRWPSPPAG